MSRTFKLFRLQQIDSQVDKIHNRLKAIESAFMQDETLRQAEQRLEAAEKVENEANSLLKHCEQEVQAQRIKIEQTEATLYGGKVHNPKELQDLQNEAAALKRFLTVLEDRQLEAMIQVEEAEAQRQSAQQNLNQVSAQADLEHTSLRVEQSQLQKDLDRQLEERNAISSTIPEEDLKLYESIRQKRSGVAVAKVVDKSCSACGSFLNTALLSSAHSPTQITICATCARILYVG
jgi:hypothetical protein